MKTIQDWLEATHKLAVSDCEGIKASGMHDLRKKVDVHYYDAEGNYEETIPKKLDQLLDLINEDTPDGWRDYHYWDWHEGWAYLDDTMRKIHPLVCPNHFLNLFAHAPDFEKVLNALNIDEPERIIGLVEQYNSTNGFAVYLLDSSPKSTNQFISNIKSITFQPDGVTGTYSVKYRPESVSYIVLLAMDTSSDFMCSKAGGHDFLFNFDDVNKLINFLETGVNAFESKGALHAL